MTLCRRGKRGVDGEYEPWARHCFRIGSERRRVSGAADASAVFEGDPPTIPGAPHSRVQWHLI